MSALQTGHRVCRRLKRLLSLLRQPGYAWRREHLAQEFAVRFPRFYPEYFACIMAYSWGR